MRPDSVEVTIDVGTCTVSYNANGGEGAPASQTKDKYFPLALSAVKPTRAGYFFLGWATSNAADAAAKYQPGDTFKGNEDTTLYAMWTPLTPIEGLPAGLSTVFVDGVRYPVEDGGAPIPAGAKIIEAYTFQNPDSTDPHLRYPTDLMVWRVTENEDGTPVVKRLEALDNVLQYSGFSIRISGTPGIRMITSVPTDMKQKLTSGGLAGYTLEEYGTLIAWADELGETDLTMETKRRDAFAYKKGVADPVFNVTGGLTQYTNVLVDFSYNQVPRDLAMRSYMILTDNSSGEKVILYGGPVQRSIGYVAYQNRSAFAPRTSAYEFVWNLIHVTYGSKYDSEYKK